EDIAAAGGGQQPGQPGGEHQDQARRMDRQRAGESLTGREFGGVHLLYPFVGTCHFRFVVSTATASAIPRRVAAQRGTSPPLPRSALFVVRYRGRDAWARAAVGTERDTYGAVPGTATATAAAAAAGRPRPRPRRPRR